MIGNVSLSINLDVLSIVNVITVYLFIVYIVLAVSLFVSHVLCQKWCLMMGHLSVLLLVFFVFHVYLDPRIFAIIALC